MSSLKMMVLLITSIFHVGCGGPGGGRRGTYPVVRNVALCIISLKKAAVCPSMLLYEPQNESYIFRVVIVKLILGNQLVSYYSVYYGISCLIGVFET